MAIITGTNFNVVIGQDNHVSGSSGKNIVVACQQVTVAGGYNVIAGLDNKSLTGSGGVILGGMLHTFTSLYCNGVAILGGYKNELAAASYNGAMLGGTYNKLRGIYSSMSGGSHNEIQASVTGAFVGGGYGNVIGSGGNRAVICGGVSNIASGADSIASGNRARSTRAGEFSHNSIDFRDGATNTASNDRGYHRLTGNLKTTNDTIASLMTITLSAGTAYNFMIMVVANENGGGNRASYMRRVTVYRDGTGSATIQGSVETIGTDVESDAAWDFTVDVNSNDVRLRVTGDGANSVNWAAVVEWVAIGETIN